MIGLEEFIKLFGKFTISDLIIVIFAGLFLLFVYKKVRDYFNKKIIEQNKRAEAEKLKDAQLKEALEAVRKYPEYRQQSINIQQSLEAKIQDLRAMQEDTRDRLVRMEEQDKKRECSKLRDMLLKEYRYYTNKEQNPDQSWTRMESEAFWDLFRDYEEAGGNGYMHTIVQPEMCRLTVIEVE